MLLFKLFCTVNDLGLNQSVEYVMEQCSNIYWLITNCIFHHSDTMFFDGPTTVKQNIFSTITLWCKIKIFFVGLNCPPTPQSTL